MHRGMVPNPPPPEVPVSAGSKRRRDEHQPDAEPSILHMKLTPHHEYDLELAQRTRYELVDRIHTEILMSAGILVKSFCHLHELIHTLIDGIEERLRGRLNGIIHRDVSVGNLLIFPVITWDDEKTFGRLLDWNHAMITDKYIHLPSQYDSELSEFISSDLKRLKLHHNISATKEAIEETYRYDTYHVAYFEDAAVSLKISQSEENPLTVASLGWDHEVSTHLDIYRDTRHDASLQDIPWPDFKKRVPQKGERTGTLPFISFEVLMQLSMYDANKRRFKRGEFRHNSVHDLESFLWVLVYICLTRKGPGIGMFRDELAPNAGLSPLRDVIRDYFDGKEDILKDMKHQLLEVSDTFESDIIASFHPYFDSVKPLVRKWWARLCLAYRHHGNEYYHIHSHILRILDKALPTIPRSDNDPDTVAVIQRRKEHHQRSLEMTATLHAQADKEAPQAEVKMPQTEIVTTLPSSPVIPEASPGYRRVVTDSTIQTSSSGSPPRKRQAR
ncbi:hypothetical protein D9615_007823 [Tricholomella constricta]|uniref:Fungal-type protein kinase domain-containing protein n=1 Tax=Tricholomella constricta TaxID=117010 RepID=A0A8H5H4Q1_9AGAR|nr:hypothetical protein D9615_007823 [Tricholomella constricta]